MYHVDFPATGTGSGLQFTWDERAGTVSGRDATTIMVAIRDALRDGTVTSHPWPTSYPVQDPLHNLPEMAAVISQCWRLPDDWRIALEKHYPPDDPPDDDLPCLF